MKVGDIIYSIDYHTKYTILKQKKNSFIIQKQNSKWSELPKALWDRYLTEDEYFEKLPERLL